MLKNRWFVWGVQFPEEAMLPMLPRLHSGEQRMRGGRSGGGSIDRQLLYLQFGWGLHWVLRPILPEEQQLQRSERVLQEVQRHERRLHGLLHRVQIGGREMQPEQQQMIYLIIRLPCDRFTIISIYNICGIDCIYILAWRLIIFKPPTPPMNSKQGNVYIQDREEN